MAHPDGGRTPLPGGRPSSPARRRAIRAAAAAAALLLLGTGVLAVLPGGGPTAQPRSTVAARLLDRDGNGTLERGPGEPLADRTELAPARSVRGERGRFAQISDLHVRDEESPARLPVLDRYGGPLRSTFRPQEALSPHVLAATVAAVNRVRPQAVVTTGDLIDNAQANELAMLRQVLDGGRVDPDSGSRGYDGLQRAANPDPLIYRPDLDAPRHPGLLAAAQRPFHSPGLLAPWHPVAGNHDLLAQGEVPPTPRIDAVATGDRLLTELDESVGRGARGRRRADPRLVDALLAQGLPGRTRGVTADPARRMPATDAVTARLRRPAGGGTASAAAVAGRLDHSFDIGPHLRGIALDLVNRSGGSSGLVAPGQLAWLRGELRRAGRRRVVVFSHQPLPSSSGGETLLRVLAGDRRVVAAVAGHTHRNRIAPRRSADGGFWLIETASLADYPQQARAFRLVETAGGHAALETWMVDHGEGPGGLAARARELAFLDVQGGRPAGAAGGRGDRNVRLHLPR